VQGKVGHAPRLPNGINTMAWAPKRVSIHHSPPEDREEGDWIDEGTLIGFYLIQKVYTPCLALQCVTLWGKILVCPWGFKGHLEL
jgi:hypothetical protein